MDLIMPEVWGYAAARGFNIMEHFEQPAIIRYGPGGKFDYHMDYQLDGGLGQFRKIAVVLALNDDFEGGGTRWLWPHPEQPLTALPKAGTISVFPSILLHAGLPVISGERWVVVTWAFGPPWM